MLVLDSNARLLAFADRLGGLLFLDDDSIGLPLPERSLERLPGPIRAALTELASGQPPERACVAGAFELKPLDPHRPRDVHVLRHVPPAVDSLAGPTSSHDRLVRVLSHELRNPLMSLRLSTAELHALDLGAQAEPLLATLERQVSAMRRVLDGVLELASAQLGPTSMEALPMRKLVRQALSGFAEEQRRRVEVLELGEPALVDGDEALLVRALRHVFMNALRFSPEGSVVEARLDETSSSEVTLTVWNEGRGIHAREAEQLFQPFAKGDDVSDRRSAGVGLSVVREVMLHHAGRVLVIDGPGTTLELAWPRSEQRTSRPPRTASRILLLDDEVDNRELLALYLRRQGHDVTVASTGDEALTQLLPEEAGFDVAILDLGLPDMSGLEVARRVRRAHPELRLFALTGFGSAEDRHASRLAGFDLHLTKPVELEHLVSLLERPSGDD